MFWCVTRLSDVLPEIYGSEKGAHEVRVRYLLLYEIPERPVFTVLLGDEQKHDAGTVKSGCSQ